MSPAEKAAALLSGIAFAAAVAVVLIWWFAAQVQNLRRRTDEDAADGDLTAVIPWADLTQPQRQLPAWVDDPTAYRDEFLDVVDQLAGTDPAFADDMERLGQCLAANPEETR